MMSDDEIRAIEKGLIKDKENALKIEAVKLEEAPPDQQDIGEPSGGGAPSGGEEESGGSPTDLGASLAALGEVDELDDADLEEQDMVSKVINISKYPVRPNSNLSLKSSLLGEATANGPDYVARDKKNKKRRVSPNNQNVDHSRLVGHDKNKQTDSITHPFGAKNDLINPFKDPLSETDFDDFAQPSEYLREKNIFNDTRLSEIESVIKSLKRAPKISESDNTSGEDS